MENTFGEKREGFKDSYNNLMLMLTKSFDSSERWEKNTNILQKPLDQLDENEVQWTKKETILYFKLRLSLLMHSPPVL